MRRCCRRGARLRERSPTTKEPWRDSGDWPLNAGTTIKAARVRPGVATIREVSDASCRAKHPGPGPVRRCLARRPSAAAGGAGCAGGDLAAAPAVAPSRSGRAGQRDGADRPPGPRVVEAHQPQRAVRRRRGPRGAASRRAPALATGCRGAHRRQRRCDAADRGTDLRAQPPGRGGGHRGAAQQRGRARTAGRGDRRHAPAQRAGQHQPGDHRGAQPAQRGNPAGHPGDPDHRQPDQPAGAQRRHRSGACRRTRARFRGGRRRSARPGRPYRRRHRGSRPDGAGYPATHRRRGRADPDAGQRTGSRRRAGRAHRRAPAQHRRPGGDGGGADQRNRRRHPGQPRTTEQPVRRRGPGARRPRRQRGTDPPPGPGRRRTGRAGREHQRAACRDRPGRLPPARLRPGPRGRRADRRAFRSGHRRRAPHPRRPVRPPLPAAARHHADQVPLTLRRLHRRSAAGDPGTAAATPRRAGVRHRLHRGRLRADPQPGIQRPADRRSEDRHREEPQQTTFRRPHRDSLRQPSAAAAVADLHPRYR
ncbi:hypothetical protein PSEWESI4_04651 [Pseudomonas carbonaria]|uniref:Uncharacterized protein n=1 Tax=Zestomonas carbonaria TaxID=2762745 RepID=A0A7U7IBT1_9GAMM|nr:hypothetical protein PSEWESI4_04651 [Pseudomonas carbonaria]